MPISGRRPAPGPIEIAFAVLPIMGLCWLGLPANALGQINLTATGSAGVGVTDNAAYASAGTAAAQYGGLWVASAGLDGNWTGQKEAHDLRYSFGIARSFVRRGLDTQTHMLTWNGQYAASGTLTFSGSIGGALTRLDAINVPTTIAPITSNPSAMGGAITPIDPQGATLIPSSTTFFAGTVNATTSWRPTPLRAWTESTTGHMIAPVEGQQARSAYGVDQSVAHDRTAGLNSFIANAQVGYLAAPELKDSLGNVLYPESQSVHGRILAGWHRTLTAFSTASASVGGLVTTSVLGGPIIVGPSWYATYSYQRNFGMVSAALDRTPTPSLYVGQVSVSDRLSITLLLPIDRAGRFHAGGSVGYAHMRFLNASNQLVPGSDVLNANAGLTFQPLWWPVSFALTYTRLQQFAHAVSGAPPLPDIERQVLMFTVTGTWSRFPAEGAGAAAAGAEF